MKIVLIAATALLGAAFAGQAPKIDAAKLAPVVGQTWVTGSCMAPDEIVDWVIDEDGEIYRRDGGYTPMSKVTLAHGEFITEDEVGIGLTRSVYRLKDSKLKLWNEVWYEDGSASGTPTVIVENGRKREGDDPAATLDTAEYSPCPLRTMFPPEPVTALNGKWAAVKGGSCGKGTGAILFDLDRPVPRISRGPLDDMAEGEAYVLSIARDGDAWAVTEGSAFEASVYRFTLGKDGVLTQVSEYEGSMPIRFQRCM